VFARPWRTHGKAGCRRPTRSWYVPRSGHANIRMGKSVAVRDGQGDSGRSHRCWIALTLGIVLTCALAITLMALVFHSARSGRDESAGGGGRKPDG
ncbi:MAG TPA: hypothetical protein VFY87_24610, partial [Geminicoccaceae bacterium]|nr:hypothetical protein [Geminicoccaceae bacterium]